jgi:hypothetical protein
MDRGRVRPYNGTELIYISDDQDDIASRGQQQETAITSVRVCLSCGYMEFYLDPQRLKDVIEKFPRNPMETPELEKFIILELAKRRRPEDIAKDVSQRSGHSIEAAVGLVKRIQDGLHFPH